MNDLKALEMEFGEPVDAWSVERAMADVEKLADRWDELILDSKRPPLPEIIKDEERMRVVFKKYFTLRNPKF
ncbi:hypothetical protein F5Y11DRAFT_350378 [Daldinia sp. FL1419]|nr:hypothetical protein F5Y11DRAFT_350378 [Daldinia sp. FL1419]